MGLWVTKQFRDLGGDILYIGNVRELKTVERDAQYADHRRRRHARKTRYAALAADYPELAELWTRFASLPIRNAGTLGVMPSRTARLSATRCPR